MLSLRDGLLVISRSGCQERIPVKDIAVILASHRQVTFTQAVVAELAREGGVLVCCDHRHHPAAMLLPLERHHHQADRFRRQASASLPTRKRIWKEIVRAKIRAQGENLKVLRGQDYGLAELSRRVRSGDSGNHEAIAAQRYWPRLFADKAYRRGNDADGRNALLNYGYAVIRAMAARAVCAAGLHPSLGVHHKNRSNAFCLADDLMEPCRPLVDSVVAGIVLRSVPEQWHLTRENKETVLECAIGRYRVGDESRTLFDILARTAQELAAALTGERGRFRFPRIDGDSTF